MLSGNQNNLHCSVSCVGGRWDNTAKIQRARLFQQPSGFPLPPPSINITYTLGFFNPAQKIYQGKNISYRTFFRNWNITAMQRQSGRSPALFFPHPKCLCTKAQTPSSLLQDPSSPLPDLFSIPQWPLNDQIATKPLCLSSQCFPWLL